jgi:hypothetical protein
MALKAKIYEATPNRRSLTIAAHSLGNVVVSNAIAEGGLQPDRYYMLDAAVPIEAYDGGQPQVTTPDGAHIDMLNNMTENTWKDYPSKLYAFNWYKLFNSDDSRSHLTWINRFISVDSVAYNFYSPGDEVLENANDGETVTSDLFDEFKAWVSGQGLSGHTWVLQDIAEGCKNIVAERIFRDCSGGWNYNYLAEDLYFIGDSGEPYSASGATQAIADGKLTDEDLAQFGFFRKFENYSGKRAQYAALYGPTTQDGANIGNNSETWEAANELAAKPDTQWYLLSTSIPAMSFAAGEDSIDNFNPKGEESRDFDMEALRDNAKSGWPTSRVNAWGTRWLHSDVRDVALPYVYTTYEKMLNLGGLKK